MKSLTDVVSGAGLSVYAEIALVIFLIAFLGDRDLALRAGQAAHARAPAARCRSTATTTRPLARDDRDSSLRSE